MNTIEPTRKGRDLENITKNLDAHVRLECWEGVLQVAVDIFRSSVNDPTDAHVESDSFANTARGRREATAFLRSYGFPQRIATR